MLARSIRARLTLWYTLALAGSLLLFGISTYLYVRDDLFSQIEAQLDKDLQLMQQALGKPSDEFLKLETYGSLNLFMVEHDDWPIYISNGWFNADLSYVLDDKPLEKVWTWQSSNAEIFQLKRRLVTHADKSYLLTAAYASQQTHASLARLHFALLVAIPFVLLVGLLGGYFLAGRVLAPIQYLTQRARSISADKLSERLQVRNPHDELGKLTEVLNAMLTRLEDSFHRLRQFTQDAAHELRTPLAVLRSVGEVGLEQQRSPKAYRDIIASMLEEVERMTRLSEGLLTLARAESGRLPVQAQPQAIAPIIQEAIDCVQILAEDKAQSLHFDALDEAVLSVDSHILHLALMNLLSNAIRFTPEQGQIWVRLQKPNKQLLSIEIEDTGVGIAAEHQAHVFERFYRVDSSRATNTGGTGLGLAIAKWAIEVNGGRIELESQAGKGSVFRLLF